MNCFPAYPTGSPTRYRKKSKPGSLRTACSQTSTLIALAGLAVAALAPGPGTDHTREYVPLLVYGARMARGVNLGTRKSFADLGQTIAEALGSKRLAWGESFLHVVMQG